MIPEGEFFSPMDDVIDFVTTLQEKTKETYYTSAFVPNFADKLFSAEARAVKKTPLLEYLKAHSDLRMGVYDFVKLMAVIERQNKSKKVGAREVCELVLLLRRRVRGDQGQRGAVR